MKVFLISPNRETLPDPVFPIGLAYIASALRNSGHEVQVADLCFVHDIEDTLKQSLLRYQPDVIGISFRNIDDVSYPRSVSYLPLYREVIAVCRRYSNSPVIAGGSGFTIMPDEFMSNLDIDYGIVGEGEAAIVRLMKYLSVGGSLPQGVVTPINGNNRPYRSAEWKTLIPGRDLFNANEYYEKGGMLNVQTRRGCPFRCIYCSYPRVEGARMRSRDPSDVVKEMEEVTGRTGARHFFMVDSVFNYPREYALRFCREVISRGLKIKWNCYANPGLMDPELVDFMLRAGCTGIEFGTDSLVDTLLGNLKKGFTYKQVKEVSRICMEAGMKYCHFIFLGSPGEGIEEATINIERLSALNADSSVLMAGIRIFPGTGLALRAHEELGMDMKRIGLEPVYYISPKILPEMENIIRQISSRHPSWILPGFGVNFNERLQSLLRKSGIKGGLWERLPLR